MDGVNEFFIYLTRVSIGLAIVSLPYFFFLRNDAHLNIKRVYLLCGILLAWIIPLTSFQPPQLFSDVTPVIFIDPQISADSYTGMGNGIHPSHSRIEWIHLITGGYLMGLLFLLLKNLLFLQRWNSVWNRSEKQNGVAITSTPQVFALFNRIFVPSQLKEKEEFETIILHEKAHLRQLHFIDLIMMEATLLLTWFNPFTWLISRMIKENHEHLADRQVLSDGVHPARYRAQLLNHMLGVHVIRLGHPFNHSLTFKRFQMMKKPRRNLSGTIKFLFIIPLVITILALTTGMAPQPESISGKVVFAETKQPAAGASVIIRGTSMGTVADHNGTFSLKVSGNPELVISFVGYANLYVESSKVGRNPLELTPKAFLLEVERTPEMETISMTGAFSIKPVSESDGQPFYVVDGQRVTGVLDLDPSTIEQVEVIKDPDHHLAKKYDAKDGLILISTKESQRNRLNEISEQDNAPALTEEVMNDKELFYIVEDMPMYPGGKKALANYIYSNLDYPETARQNRKEGVVQIGFEIATNGKLEEIHVVQSSDPVFDSSAKKVFESMMDWIPGSQHGKPVNVKVIVPVRFELDRE